MKVKYTELAIASGKLNGTVHAKNKSGNYIRVWAKPLNPKSAAQLLVRNRLTGLVRAFGTLGTDLISQWNAFASTIKRANRIGEIVANSGISLFVEMNANLLKLGESAITAIPTAASAANPVIAVTEATPLVLTADIGRLSTQCNAIVFATPCVSKGISNAKNKFRQIAVVTGTDLDLDDYDLHTAYVAKFGSPVVGKKLFLKMQVVRLTYPITNVPAIASSDVIAD